MLKEIKYKEVKYIYTHTHIRHFKRTIMSVKVFQN